MRRNNLCRVISALGFAASASFALDALAVPGVAANVSITTVHLAAGSNLATVTFTPAMTLAHSCDGTKMNFDHTTANGKSMLSVLLAAQLAGKKVSFLGNGTCTSINGVQVEGVNSVDVSTN